MEEWQDTGIILSARMHGENGAIISILTKEYGRHLGYFNGARSKKNRALIEQGTIVNCQWKARIPDSLGSWKLEEIKTVASLLMDNPIKLAALQSACSLCDAALPEREGHSGLYHGLSAMFDMFDSEIWQASYIFWELAFLKELGFGLDLTKCAAGGTGKLIYVSPKSGRAVSKEKGEPYKDKMLKLPEFLQPDKTAPDNKQILEALELTGYFLENWAFAQHSHGIPEARLIFQQRFAKHID